MAKGKVMMLLFMLPAIILLFMYVNYLFILRVTEKIGSTCCVEFRVWKKNPNFLLNLTVEAPFLKPIIVIDKKLAYLPDEARDAIVAHELAHVFNMSSLRATLILLSITVLAGGITIITNNHFIGYLVFILLTPVIVLFKRREEFFADLYAARIIGLEKLVKGYMLLSEINRSSNKTLITRIARLLGEPTVDERLRFIMNYLEKLKHRQ